MDSKFQELVKRGIVNIGTVKPIKECIEIFVEGDINDADYVRDTYKYSVESFMEEVEMWAKAVNEYSGYIDKVKDSKLRDFLRDISPSSPSGCDVHTIDTIEFTYHDGQGNQFPFTLRTPQDARDFKIETVLQ